MPYCQLYYHITWATKHREPLLTEPVESVIHPLLRVKAIGLGATVFALNGTVDHVHIIVSIPPKLAVATFIGQIKGVAATKFNKSSNSTGSFGWQDEYAAFTLDGKRLPNHIAYVERQKEHHKQNSTISILERCEETGAAYIHEPANIYAFDDEIWRRELDEIGF